MDLDKIIIKRTVIGIRCTACGGNLIACKEKKTVLNLAVKLLSFGTIKPKSYECENCKKRYVLL